MDILKSNAPWSNDNHESLQNVIVDDVMDLHLLHYKIVEEEAQWR